MGATQIASLEIEDIMKTFPYKLLLGFFLLGYGSPSTYAVLMQVRKEQQEVGIQKAHEFQNNRTAAKQYLRKKKASLAIPFLEKARSINVSDFENGYDLSAAYARAGQLEKARAEAMHLLTIRDTADVHTLLGDIETAAHSGKAAAEQYQIAAQMDPSEGRIFDFGRSLLGFESDAAIRIFSYGVEKYPESTILRIGLGEAFDMHGEYDKAAEALCQAMDLNADDPRPIEFLGNLPTVLPETSKLIDQRLFEFLKAHPNSAKVNYYRARNLLNSSSREPSKPEMAEGERLLRIAIRLNPRLASAYFELGWLYEREGRRREAVPEYERAVSLDPKQEKYHYRLSFVYRATGQAEKAKREIQVFHRLEAAQDAAFEQDVQERDARRSHN